MNKRSNKIKKSKKPVPEHSHLTEDIIMESSKIEPEILNEENEKSTENKVTFDFSELKSKNGEIGFVVADLANKFRLLFTFTRANFNKKLVILMCSPASVKYFGNIFRDFGIEVCETHERQKSETTKTNLNTFSKKNKGLLLCTNQEARNVNFEGVDWLINYDLSSDVQSFAKVLGNAKKQTGLQVLIVLPEFETTFLEFFKEQGIKTKEFKMTESKLASIGEKMEKLVTGNFHFAMESREAFRVFVCFYHGHIYKNIFDVKKLDLGKVAKSFGLTTIPRVAVKQFVTNEPNILNRYKRRTLADRLKVKRNN